MQDIEVVEVDAESKSFKKNKKLLTKMFAEHAGYPATQMPLVIEALKLFLAAVDGNAYYDLEIGDNEVCQDQYTLEAIRVLSKGLKSIGSQMTDVDMLRNNLTVMKRRYKKEKGM